MQTCPPIIDIDGVLVSADIITEPFCCVPGRCRGECCVQGDAGAPVTLNEIAAMESVVDVVRPLLTPAAEEEIARHGVACTDAEGELVTATVDGRDCVFAYHEHDCCFCSLERACRDGKSAVPKPVSCALYPIREVRIGGTVGLNYHRWAVCRGAAEEGRRRAMPLYVFLRAPLVRRFGEEWYALLEEAARLAAKEGYVSPLRNNTTGTLNR